MSAARLQTERRRWIFALSLLPLTWAAGQASAQTAPVGDLPVRLDVDACTRLDAARLADLLALELRVLPGSVGGRARPAARASVGCGDGAVLFLRLFDSDQLLTSASTLDGSAYPIEGRARAVALVLSEMIARRYAEPADAALATRPAVEPAPPPAPAPRTPGTSSFELGLLAGFQRSGRPQVSAPGLDAIFGWHLRPGLTLHTSARGTTASFATAPGRVWASTVSAMFAASLDRVRGRARFGAGAGVRIGWVWLRGDPAGGAASGRHLDGAWWGPCALLTASLPIVDRLLVVLHAEAGLVARPVTGQVRPPPPAPPQDVAVAGPWARAAAGVAWPF